jgi:hypothetical protein
VTETHFCALNCRKNTTWEMGRTRSRCVGCKTEFPCTKCRHADCQEARGELVPDEHGVLRAPKKEEPREEAKTEG